MRVLVIEDDPAVVSFLKKGLREASYIVESASNGVDGARMASGGTHDVIVLDLMLPGQDGFDVLRELRTNGINTPVICLTARDTVHDRVRGLDLGADDYLVKPFSFSELLARLRAVLRRQPSFSADPLAVGPLTVDVITRHVQRAGKRIDLSPTEFALLNYLAQHAGQVLSRTMILENVWDMNYDPMTNVVDVHINRLRKKVDRGFDFPLIHTIRGVGYVLREEGA
ncbi:MAG: heavy metal response regulator transcription factor [Phycisphaerae bacterium]|nr:heavy metal response regulator transcription factor [Phycisphaerae bacterium]